MRASTSLLALAIVGAVIIGVRGAAELDGLSLVTLTLVGAAWVAWLVEHERAKRSRR